MQPDAWGWVERVSWVVAVFGLPIGLLGLWLVRREQKRIADDLARRPELAVGFLPIREVGNKKIPTNTLHIEPTWKPGVEKSEPVPIYVVCCNNGNRSAREVLYNISVQQGFDFIPTGPPPSEQVIRNPITGLSMWVSKDAHVHPGDIASFETSVAVMRGRAQVEWSVEVSYDYGRLETRLTLVIDS